jgi:TPR repeat protein
MNDTYTFEDIDTVVWNCLQGSQNANDYLAYVKTMMGFKAHQKEALKLARQYWENAESEAFFPKALETVTNIAKSGNSAAMAHLGRWYRLGSGVPIDLDLSEQWYQKAVDLNDGKGHTGLGRLCWKSNPNKAAAHFKMAVSMGELNAYSHLADLDRANELEHLLNALQTNEAYADYAYGHYLIRESKTEEEKARHIHWIEKAAKKGYGYAALMMAMHHFKGEMGFDENIEVAKEWCRMGCDTGDLASLMWFSNRFLYLPESQEEAAEHLMSACMLGDKVAQGYFGGWLVGRGKSFEEQAKGIVWLRSSVAQGHPSAMYNLADALRKGKGVEVNTTEAHALLEQGAHLGNSECQCFLGIDYMYGEGVPVNKERAHDLFQIAALARRFVGHLFTGHYLRIGRWRKARLGQSFRVLHGSQQGRVSWRAVSHWQGADARSWCGQKQTKCCEMVTKSGQRRPYRRHDCVGRHAHVGRWRRGELPIGRVLVSEGRRVGQCRGHARIGHVSH